MIPNTAPGPSHTPPATPRKEGVKQTQKRPTKRQPSTSAQSIPSSQPSTSTPAACEIEREGWFLLSGDVARELGVWLGLDTRAVVVDCCKLACLEVAALREWFVVFVGEVREVGEGLGKTVVGEVKEVEALGRTVAGEVREVEAFGRSVT